MAGTTRRTAGNVKPGTAAREVQAKKMVDTGCGCVSNFASRSRCRSCGVLRGRYQPQLQSTQSTFAVVVAEEVAKLRAQLGQDAVDVPMMENGRDEAPSEEAEREQLRTLLADASVAALMPVAAGDEDVCKILQGFPFDSKSCGEDK